jgi:hypothetical protein
VIVSVRDKGTEDLFDGRDTKQALALAARHHVRVQRQRDDRRAVADQLLAFT